MTFYLQFLSVTIYLKPSNDTSKPDKHKYNNYNTRKIYINRLGTTMRIFRFT